MATKVVNFLLLKATWARLILHGCDHLATVFIPSVGLEDVMAHVEALLNSPNKL